MPKRDLVRRIDTVRTYGSTGSTPALPTSSSGWPADLAAALEVVSGYLHALNGQYAGLLDAAHVALREDDPAEPDKAWLEATDQSNLPFFTVGARTATPGDVIWRLGYEGQPGIELVAVEGEPYQQVRVNPETITGGVAGGIMYTYILHEGGGICKAVNALSGETEMESSDYAAVIQYALDSAGPDSSIIFRPGRYTVNTYLTPAQRQTLWLAAGVIFIPGGNNPVWRIVSRDRVSFHGTLTIEDELARTTTQPAIVIDDMAFSYFERIVIWNTYRGINITGTAGGTHENYYADIWLQVRDRGINLETACHDNHFGHVWIKGPAPDNWATGPGLRIATSGTQGGNSFNAIEILDMYWGMDLPGAYEVWFGNVIVDNAYGTGIWMSGQVEHLFFDTVWTASSGDGLQMEGQATEPPITYVDKVHITKLYTWLNANWGLRFSGYIKGVTFDEVTVQRCAKGVGFEGVGNNNIVINTLYTLENSEWGLNGLNAGSNVIVRNAMIEDALLNPDPFAVLGGFAPTGRFHSKGQATIVAGQTSVQVTHILDQTPQIVVVTPYGVAAPYVSARTATTFTLSIPSALGADLVLGWAAWSRPNAN